MERGKGRGQCCNYYFKNLKFFYKKIKYKDSPSHRRKHLPNADVMIISHPEYFKNYYNCTKRQATQLKVGLKESPEKIHKLARHPRKRR